MRQLRIKEKIQEDLNPTLLELVNESHMHSGHADESHYKLLVVSESFNCLSRLERQQQVHALLKDEFSSGLHALTMRLKTPQEWEEEALKAFESPDCAHKK